MGRAVPSMNSTADRDADYQLRAGAPRHTTGGGGDQTFNVTKVGLEPGTQVLLQQRFNSPSAQIAERW